MQTENEPYTVNIGGWTVRIRKPESAEAENPTQESEPPRVFLLLHGFTGDENVMWIFTRALPANAWIFAPRAPLISNISGYSWVPREEGLPTLDDYTDVARELIGAFNSWLAEAGNSETVFDVMGFSQGAGLAFALATLYPERVQKVMALAGFLPRDDSAADQDPGRYKVLEGKSIYLAHGKKDDIIPIRFAEKAVQILQAAGAQVTYCESDVGHKLGAACLRGIENFIQE